MASHYPGPFCEEVGLLAQDLYYNQLQEIQGSLKNGLVLELRNFAEKSNIPHAKVLQWIQTLQPNSNASLSTLKYRLTNAYDVNKKLNSKKKVKGYKSTKEFKASKFNVAEREKCTYLKVNQDIAICDNKPNVGIELMPKVDEIGKQIPEKHSVHLDSVHDHGDTNHFFEKTKVKNMNSLEHEILKKQKVLKQIQTLISTENETLSKLKERKGHYSVRNVEKRDVRAAENRKKLHKAKTQILRHSKQIQELKRKKARLFKINKKLKYKFIESSSENDKARKSMLHSEEHVQILIEENESLKLKIEEQCKTTSKKHQSFNYLKRKVNTFRSGLTNNLSVQKLKKSLADKDIEIKSLINEVENLKENLQDRFLTKNCDGSFNNSVRLCIIELAGLEVAIEKVPKVIQAVSLHMYSRKLTANDLPTKSTTQSIVDEGHYLAKRLIASKLDSADFFGINRDGTTRKKQKILDTSVTLNSGEVMSLGFTRVAHETAVAINQTTKDHVQEMADLYLIEKPTDTNSENFIRRTLEKLSFSMSDRASNEKAADRLLDEWRDDMLNSSQHVNVKSVQHFHCMAHVLLGFHKYSCDDIKKMENTLVEDIGPIGRDCLPQFKSWRKTGSVVERVVRTVSDTFGPAGDPLGLRDRWEAHCSENAVKSLIGNYKDNRFNGLFQTAAEVLVHAEDMISVLNSVQQPNRKLISVKADLQCQVVRVLLQCFGLFYVKVTGPYWNLVTSGLVPYVCLHNHIQSLVDFLKTCSTSPEILLNQDIHWELEDDLRISNVPSKSLFIRKLYIEPINKEMLFDFVSSVSSSMLRCISKQLADFLPGGQYSTSPTKELLSRTGFAQSTNLACEHHFGDLDSSQKRRPNASMHHHSSIQLLKRNRKNLTEWLNDMPSTDRLSVFKDARKGGRSLRDSHLKTEKNVLAEISKEMVKDKQKKGKKRKMMDEQEEIDCSEFENETNNEAYNINEYVAVAYQDMWYPGVIENVNDNSLTVKFMEQTRKLGFYTWPARKDVQRVSKEFIIFREFIPECRNSGRLWYIENHENISKLFEKYRKIYF